MSLSKFCKCVATIMPTYFLYIYLKKKRKNQNEDSFKLSKKFDSVFLIIAICIVIAHFVIEFLRINWYNNWALHVFYVLLSIQISRNIEIPFAFLSDVLDKLNPNSSSNKNRKTNASLRIELTVLVYFEILLNYSLIFCLLSCENWCNIPNDDSYFCNNGSNTLSMFDSIYFSVVTIATLGYGDITPKLMLPKLLVIMEVMTSFVLVIMSIAIYVSSNQKNND